MLSISFYEACEIVSRYSHTLDEITIFVFQLAIRPGVFSLFSFFLLLLFFPPLSSLSSNKDARRRGFLPNTKENKGSGILGERQQCYPIK